MSDTNEKYIDNYYFSRINDELGHKSVRHYHPMTEIYYMKQGACDYFIENHTYKVQSGDIVIIPSGIIHKTTYSNTPHTRYLLNFGEDYITKELAVGLAVGKVHKLDVVCLIGVVEVFRRIVGGSTREADALKAHVL